MWTTVSSSHRVEGVALSYLVVIERPTVPVLLRHILYLHIWRGIAAKDTLVLPLVQFLIWNDLPAPILVEGLGGDNLIDDERLRTQLAYLGADACILHNLYK